jgi:hypothetical protein
MDPNVTLAEIRELINKWQADTQGEIAGDHFAEELVEKIDNLDRWIRAGGFLPADWRN